QAIATAEARLLPVQLGADSSPWARALGIGYRFGKWFAVDLPQDHFLMVAAHEVFGHGSRLREIDAHGIHYSFDAPIPYGPGGAVTYFEGDVFATRADVLAIEATGIEAQNTLADDIARRAVLRGAIPSRDAW